MKAHLHLLLGISVSLFLVACQNEDKETVTAPKISNEAQAQPAERPSESETRSMRDLDEGPPEHVTHRPSEVEWRDGPDSFEPGAQFAILEGDPGASGVFTLQLKLPDGFVINPHWHPNVERVTVLAGTFHLGSGEEVDKEAAEALPAGTYTAMPPKMVHHAIAEGRTILQLTTVGPWEIQYVDPQDDPRKRD